MKKCPYCAEDIQDAAIVCRFCNRDLSDGGRATVTTQTPTSKSLYERKLILEAAIRSQFTPTMRVESQSDHQAVLVFGRAPNHLLHFLIGVFTLGFWWIVWLFIAVSSREYRRLITVDEQGRVISSDASNIPGKPAAAPARTPEQIDRERQANHRLGTALIAIVISACALVFVAALWSSIPGQPRIVRPSGPSSTPAASAPARTPIGQSATESARQAPVPATWREVKTWSGSGMKETETFQTTSREWRIRWKSMNEPFANAGLLQIYVYDSKGDLVSLAANKQGPGQDESYVRSGPGTHYLMINSANIDWTVTVEDRR